MDQASPGQYKILQKLGAGGMGTVYLAMDQKLKRMVAIKVLNTNIDHDSSTFKRFVREIEVTAQLNHPNIIKIYQVQTDGEFPQLIMEFIAGKSLMDYLRDANLSLPLKLELMQKVALAVDHAHKKKIIHRDIKPSNIMVRNNGEPILMDFGIAKVTKVEDKSLTRSGEIVGTLQYMSPEQATGARRDVDHRTDIYSLGAVMYHILTGQMPITAPTFMDMLDKIVHEEPIPLRELNSEIPMEVESICLKAMAKDKQKRYATAQALADDIGNYLKGKKTTAVSFVQQQKLRKMGKKIGLPLGIVAALALVLGLIFFVVVPHIAQTRQEQALVQSLADDYQQAQALLQTGKIEDQPVAYQKLVHAWNISKQATQNQTPTHLTFQQNIAILLCQTGYDLGVSWWTQDQDKSIVYFASIADIASAVNIPANIEKNMAAEAHLAYLRRDPTAFQKCFEEILRQTKNKQNIAEKYPEVALLQAKIQCNSKNYNEAVTWLSLIPKNKHQQESLYYQGLCQYHLGNFRRAEELLLAAYQIKQTTGNDENWQRDMALYIADSLAHQFAYQKIPVVRYQPVLGMLEQLGRKVSDMSPEQLQHYLEMQARYHIELLGKSPERSAELGKKVLDLTNRSLQNDPLYAPSYLQRGFAYGYLGEFALAWEDNEYAFQLDPQQSEAIRQMWELFPYYMSASDNYIEKINSMIFRAGVKNQVNPCDVCREDFIQLGQEYNEAVKNVPHISFHQENFDKFYRNLSQPWKDIRNLAKSSLVSMVPYQETLKALEQVMQKPDAKEADIQVAKELQELIRQQQIQEEQIHWCYFISRVPYHGWIPQQILAYVQKQERFLKFLRYGILEQPTALAPAMQNNWLLLQFLAARILAQLPTYSQEYGSEFLYELMKDEKRPLELRIIVAKSLHDAGLTYLDYGFLASYPQRSKSEYHGKFLDMQVASLLISLRENDRRVLQTLVETTPYPIVPMFVYSQLPESETQFLKSQLQTLWPRALKSEDHYVRMLAVLNCAVMERYQNQPRSNAMLDIPKILLDALRPGQHSHVQKAALYLMMTHRRYITKDCYLELEKCLDHTNPELKLLAISALAGLSHPRVIKIVFNDAENFQEQIAFFYGLIVGEENRQFFNQQPAIFHIIEFLKTSQSIENRGMIYCMACYFLPYFQMSANPMQKIWIDNHIQLLTFDYLQQKNHLLLFWTLAGIMTLKFIPNEYLGAIQNIQQDMTMPLHIRKIATSVLLCAQVKQIPLLQQQPVFEKIQVQIRKNPDDPDELWPAVLLGYKQALLTIHSAVKANYSVIGKAGSYQTWDYYVLRFQRDMIDTELCPRFQRSLENILALLDLYPQRNPKQEKEWRQAMYLLSLLHIQHDNFSQAEAILGKDNCYLRDIRLSELWSRLHPADLPAIIQHWQSVTSLSAYQKALLLRFQAKIALDKRDYQQSNALAFQQYLVVPEDPSSPIFLAENKLAQKDFAGAHEVVAHILYLTEHSTRAYWTQARIYASQKDYDDAYQAIQKIIANASTAHPIRPKDLADPLWEGMDRGRLCYYLARRAIMRSAHTEVILWLEQALQYKAPIPSEWQGNRGQINLSMFIRYQADPQFQKIWRELEKLPRK